MMARPRILLVEDDRKTAGTVGLYLDRAGFGVTAVHDGLRGLEEARSGGYDLLILDLMLPGLDGLRLCRAVRTESTVPILLLTARSTEDDRVRGLDLGADDYVAKPFSPRELVARVRAVLRRVERPEAPAPNLCFRGLRVDLERREVRAGGALVELTPTELRLLATLARAPGRAFSREELVERVFDPEADRLHRTVDVHVRNLRRKIEPDRDRPSFVQTVFGVGYRFCGERDAP